MKQLDYMLNRVQVLIDLGTYANVNTIQDVVNTLNHCWDNVSGIECDALTAELLQLSIYADEIISANEYFAAMRIYDGIAKSAKKVRETCRDLSWNK